jgi:hypothetical protein
LLGKGEGEDKLTMTRMSTSTPPKTLKNVTHWVLPNRRTRSSRP